MWRRKLRLHLQRQWQWQCRAGPARTPTASRTARLLRSACLPLSRGGSEHFTEREFQAALVVVRARQRDAVIQPDGLVAEEAELDARADADADRMVHAAERLPCPGGVDEGRDAER